MTGLLSSVNNLFLSPDVNRDEGSHCFGRLFLSEAKDLIVSNSYLKVPCRLRINIYFIPVRPL